MSNAATDDLNEARIVDQGVNADQVRQLLEELSQCVPLSPTYIRGAKILDDLLIDGRLRMPAATPIGPKRRLTLGMATYDDYDGVYFSVQALRLYHPSITSRTEILVVDNNPRGQCAEALKQLEHHVAGYRYVPADSLKGTAVRDLVFREANADFVLCMDSHVLFVPGSLEHLLDYLDQNPTTSDLLQGPILLDDLQTLRTHFDLPWSRGSRAWQGDDRAIFPAAPPFDIPSQGLGVFACRKDVWPGFNPRMHGIGGGEAYLHEKFRRQGARTLCLPFLRWVHRFNQPLGIPYTPTWDDRVRNFLIGASELGIDPAPLIDLFTAVLGRKQASRLVAKVQREIAGPFHWLDAIYCASNDTGARWKRMMGQFRRLTIDAKVRRFAPIQTPHDPEIGRVMSLRAIVAIGKRHKLNNVLFLEDSIDFAQDAQATMAAIGRELETREWSVVDLVEDGCTGQGQFAVALHCTTFDRLLLEIPDSPAEVALWLRNYKNVTTFFNILKVRLSRPMAKQCSREVSQRR
jgi:hypothetical protein